MKSPSPDIANRNTIKDTKIPIDDVKRYLDNSRNVPSPRLASTAPSADPELLELRQQNKVLEFTVQQLKSQNEEYSQALQERAVQRGRALSQGDEGGAHCELQERVIGLLQENRRLGDLIDEKEHHIQSLINDNKRLSNDNSILQTHVHTCKTCSAAPIGPTQAYLNSQSINQDANTIRNFYENRIEPEMRRNEGEWLGRIRDLSDRLNRAQNQLTLIEKEVRRNSLAASSPFDGRSSGYTKTVVDKPMDATSDIQISLSRSRDGANTKSDRRHSEYIRQAEETTRELKAKCGELERENDDLRGYLKQAEEQQVWKDEQIRKLREVSTSRSLSQSIEDLTRKIQTLEDELSSKNLLLNTTQRQLRSTR
jgi:hypothetical protein